MITMYSDKWKHSFPSPGKKGRSPMTKEELIPKIIEMLEVCNDIPLIHLIYKLLVKSL